MNIDDFAKALRPAMVQDRNYTAIQAVPAWERIEINILEVPQEVRDSFLRESPRTTTVLVGMYARKGEEHLTFNAGQGSSDGLPIVSILL